MLRGEYHEAHHGSLDLIQAHEQWDFNPGITGNPTRPTAAADGQCGSNGDKIELSEWMEQVVKQLSESSAQTPLEAGLIPHDEETSFFMSSNGEYRPQKLAKRQHPLNDDVEALHGPCNVTPLLHQTSPDQDQEGLSLLALLLECAVSISVENLAEANRMLLELSQLASPYGPSCAERMVAHFARAMSSRVMNSWLGVCAPLLTTHKTVLPAFQAFNAVSPFVKFAHFTSNQAILEAFHRRDRVHVIDLDIMQGLQWPALFHILATRVEGPPHIRLTGLGQSMELLQETGKQLSAFAKRLGLSFEFHPVAKKPGNVDPAAIRGRRGEAVAVHWLQHSLYDATGPDWKTMRLLEQLSPRVFTLVEQDITHTGSFLDRFVGSLHYYSTVFDSLGATLPIDDQNRNQVEHSLLGREISNILAVGGPARSGEDKFGSWRAELGRRGTFGQVAMSSNSLAQAQLILNMFPAATHGYTIMQGNDGTLRLGWKDISLYTASSWTCIKPR